MAWLLIAASYLFNALGGTAWFIFEVVLNSQPFPSIADAFYLMYYPLFLLGIIYLPTRKLKRSDRITLILDISIVMLAALTLFWNFLIGPTLELGLNEPLIILVLSVIYPLADLMLLFALLMLIFQNYKIKNQQPLVFLLISALVMVLINSIFIYQSLLGVYISGGPLDIGWVVAFSMAGLAGVLQANIMGKEGTKKDDDASDSKEDINDSIMKRKKSLTLYLPYLWVFIAYFMLVWSHFYEIYINHYYLILIVLIIIALAIFRQILTLRENEWLYNKLIDAYDKQEQKIQERTADLASTNEELQKEITQRKKAEQQLNKYQEHLEELVEKRTGELKTVNEQLLKEIEERERIQNALKESESTYRAIFENTGTSTMIIEDDMYISLINAETERLTGYSKEEIEGKRRWTEFVYADDLGKMVEYHNQRRILEDSIPKTYEARCVFKDGKIRNIIITVDMIPGTRRSVASFLDITDRKKAELQIKKSLDEKIVLLREIHHRVNNNMQIISSLLNLQSFHIADEKALNVFRESQNRVKSMGMIYEKLYQSKDISHIDFADYISSLVSGIFSSYEIDTNHIKLKIDAQQILMGIETAIPCGLIINELVTNALKHAFVGRENGELDITLQILSDDTYQLTIKDDGIGFPENIDFENVSTVGLQLVNGLVDQIDGTIEMDAGEGTKFSIIFKEVRYLERM